MSFEINSVREAGLEITEIKNTANASRVQIIPSVGALWHGWWVNRKNGETNLIKGYADADDLQQHLKESYRSAKLSPFACRIPQGRYTYQGKEYEFVNKFSDGNAIHGLLADKPFQQVDTVQHEDSASLSYKFEYRHDDDGYPFDYNCIVTYTLHADNKVTLNTLIKNISEVTIPIVDGWHPYFTTGSKVNDCLLQFYANQLVEFDEHLIPTGKLLPFDGFLQQKKIGETELDHSFLLDKNAPQPKCTFTDPANGLAIKIYPSEHYPILQLYIPPDRQSMAIETLSGAPNAFNNGMELVLVSPGEEKLFSVTYEATIAE